MDTEKDDTSAYLEDVKAVEDAAVPEVLLDEVETKKILRRSDLRLMPLLSVLYLMSFLDRENG